MNRKIALACFALVAVAAPFHAASPFRAGGGPDLKPARPIDAKKIIEEIQGDFGRVLDDLDNNDPSAEARRAQKRIADGIKKLLDDPDPPSANPKSATNAPKPQAANKAPPSKPNPQPLPSKPKAGEAAPSAPKQSAKLEADPKLAERLPTADKRPNNLENLMKEPWSPELPPRTRTEIDTFGPQRFMPRYEDLLREYYRSLAENRQREPGK